MPDANDIAELERAMHNAVLDLERRVGAVSMARQIKELHGEYRKNLLARYCFQYRSECDSDAGQERLARANPQYQAELDKLADELRQAERHRQRTARAQEVPSCPRAGHTDRPPWRPSYRPVGRGT